MWFGKLLASHRFISVCLLFIILCLNGCGLHAPAPVSELQPGFHKVNRGETLYAIAFRYGLDYRNLAALNHLHPPYKIQAGQKIRLQASKPKTSRYWTKKPISKRKITSVRLKPQTQYRAMSHTPIRTVSRLSWQWPTRGTVISGFSPSVAGNKGIDIAGQYGQAVYASAAGVVVYCGSGLRGYGQLIIIKHNDEYLSAYAHNSQLLVKEGMVVKTGQQIAKMGNSASTRIKLHFEIRQAGKPVNPLIFLAKN